MRDGFQLCQFQDGNLGRRGKELSGFKDWLEKFSGWLSLSPLLQSWCDLWMVSCFYPFRVTSAGLLHVFVTKLTFYLGGYDHSCPYLLLPEILSSVL